MAPPFRALAHLADLKERVSGLANLCRHGFWCWFGSQFGKFSQVLDGGCKQELVAGTFWSAQPQSIEFQDALEMT
jgi:hypothetical protein